MLFFKKETKIFRLTAVTIQKGALSFWFFFGIIVMAILRVVFFYLHSLGILLLLVEVFFDFVKGLSFFLLFFLLSPFLILWSLPLPKILGGKAEHCQ